ncbi:ScyD/ScyE family protein [Streptomyces sp. NPDC051207]|uniref:ScyD/ScyE family protein n=1 Tax=Streptomyces sp. NPDC051207 TaxID=3154641 RepID=UPI00341CA712
MRNPRMRLALVVATGAALAVCAGVAPAGADAGRQGGKPVVKVVATGLDNPRQLSYDHGDLYVAEAGRGGKKCIGAGPEGERCVGLSSAVTKVHRHKGAWKHHRVVEGLPSLAQPDGGFATGVDGVSARHGRLWAVETYAPAGSGVPTARPWNTLGKLLRIQHGKAKIAADVSAVEFRHNPHTTALDSNPYAVLALPDGRRIVADAAGNDLIEVSRSGRARPFTVFPDHDGHETVPTSLALGGDGKLYVGELNGLTDEPTARVWRVDVRTGKILDWKSGFGPVTGVAVNRKGDLYVSQLFGGVVTKVSHDDERTHVKVPYPAGLALDGQGKLYVSAWSVADRDGTVVKGEKTPGGQLWKILGF